MTIYAKPFASIPLVQGWTTEEMLETFEVLGFSYGFCIVERKSDGVRGTLSFGPVEQEDGSVIRVYHTFVGVE
jgi:hypothetical protein